MAIVRLTNAQTVQSYVSDAALIAGLDASRMSLLDNGRMVLGWDTRVGVNEVLNVTTVDALGLNRSAIVAAAIVPASKYIEQPKFASSATGGFFTVWGSDLDSASATSGDTQGKVFNALGNTASAIVNLSAAPGGSESTPSVTRLADGNYLTIWSDTGTTSGLSTSTDIKARIQSAAGAPIGAEFTMNTVTAGMQFGTDLVTLGDGRSVAMWATGSVSLGGVQYTGLRGRFIDAAGAGAGAEFAIDTITPASKYEAKTIDLLALGNGGFVAIWEEDSGSTEQIHFQRFTPAGAKAGGEFQVEVVAGARHILNFLTTELADGGFAIAWYQTGGGTPSTSHVRQFSMTGAEIGTETSLNTIAGAGAGGVNVAYDMQLMADGHVMTFGSRGAAVATQVFDFGDERLLGGALPDSLYGKNGVNDVILGMNGNDRLFGLSGNDRIDGGAGGDLLNGGAGNDRLIGGDNNDTLLGGSGADAFVFNVTLSASTNKDTITDFTAGADKIELSRTVFGALAAGGLPAVQFFAGAGAVAAPTASERIVYDTATGDLYYDADGAGGAAAVKFATLSTKPAITQADILIA